MDNELFSSLHRQWIRANLLKKYFDNELPNSRNNREAFDPVAWSVQKVGVFMALWYAVLYSVCETLRKEGVTIPEAEKEFDEIYDSLRLFRNATLHVQGKYWSPKLFEIMKDEKSPTKIRHVHDKIGDWLLREIEVRKQTKFM